MNQQDLFKKLGLILNELNEQYQFLAENPQQLSELELELFQANANFLAEHVQIIKKINQIQQPSENTSIIVSTNANAFVDEQDVQEESQVEAITFSSSETEEESINTKEDLTQEIQEEPNIFKLEEEIFKLDRSPSTFEFILNDHAEHERFDFEKKDVSELFNRPLSDEEEGILAQKIKLRGEQTGHTIEPDEDEIGPEPFLVTKNEFPIDKEDLKLELAPVEDLQINKNDPVEDPTYKPTLNELLAKRGSESINTTSGTTVKDLKQAISLNDKLLYIKDLFNGYNLAYAEAIELANKLPNFEAADNFFKKNYAIKNSWSEKQATVDKFYQVLNQRFKQ